MPHINLALKDVGCRKPKCKRRMEPTARHHRKCETMFIRAFDHVPKKRRNNRYRTLVKIYHMFRPRDIVVLCAWHHCEIHLIYDKVIAAEGISRGRILTDFTWPQSDTLMRTLRDICKEWEERDTPGRNPIDCTPDKRFPLVVKRRKKRRESAD